MADDSTQQELDRHFKCTKKQAAVAMSVITASDSAVTASAGIRNAKVNSRISQQSR